MDHLSKLQRNWASTVYHISVISFLQNDLNDSLRDKSKHNEKNNIRSLHLLQKHSSI